MNKKQYLLKHLYSAQRGTIKPGLERTLQLLDFLGNPHLAYPCIHIAGTNGKGSTSSLIASIVQEGKYKVGLYTSPHIFDFNERIRINDKEISDDDIIDIYEKINKISRQINATFFEITTAMAFAYFKDKKIDIAIIETGLGGAFDSTNVVMPLLSILTSISVDHTEYLGNSLFDITNEKIGIIKPKTTVLSVNNDNLVIEQIGQRAKSVNSRVFVLNEYPHVSIISYTRNLHMCAKIVDIVHGGTLTVVSPLIGVHQAININAALFAIGIISTVFHIEAMAIINGIENVKKNTGLKYRIDCVSTNPLTVIDVAHNVASITSLVNTLDEASTVEKWNFIFGVMADKNVKEMLEIIMLKCDNLIIIQPNTSRAEKKENIASIARSVGFEKIHIPERTNDIVDIMNELNAPTVVCGSFYVAEEIAEILNANDKMQ